MLISLIITIVIILSVLWLIDILPVAYNVPRFGEISEEQFHKINEQSTCKKPVSKKIFTYKLKYDIDLIPVS